MTPDLSYDEEGERKRRAKIINGMKNKILYVYIQGGIRRGGLTPALAPRMPVISRMYI